MEMLITGVVLYLGTVLISGAALSAIIVFDRVVGRYPRRIR